VRPHSRRAFRDGGLSPIIGLERRESAAATYRNDDGGSERVATENAVPYHDGIDNRERSLFQAGWDLPFSFSLSLSLSLSLSAPEQRPTSFAPTTIGGLSLLQIGLVVLRVHQDNSGLALCLLQESAASGADPAGVGGGGGAARRERKGGVGSGTYCTSAARGLCFGLFEIREGAKALLERGLSFLPFSPPPPSLSLSLSLSLSRLRCDTLDKCKERIVYTSLWIADPC